jgi:hypothetical protein
VSVVDQPAASFFGTTPQRLGRAATESSLPRPSLLSILLPAFTMSACAAPSDSASLDVAATASPITGGRLTTDGE